MLEHVRCHFRLCVLVIDADGGNVAEHHFAKLLHRLCVYLHRLLEESHREQVAVKSNADGLQVDLRLNWKQAASSIVAAAKELGSNGEASLAVSDDKHEGAAASVVVTDASGRVLDSKPTTVGEDA